VTKADGQSKALQAADATASKGAPGGGQLNQFRERIVTELKMDAEQQQRLDPIFAEMRNKFMGLRDLPEEARARQSAVIRSDMRARVEEILKPEQKARYAEIVSEVVGRAGGGQTTHGRIYLLEGGKPTPIDVRVGLSDGAMSEVAGDGVVEGADVIIGLQGGAASNAPAPKGSPPRMFF
jgi:HlyD family secretion protein